MDRQGLLKRLDKAWSEFQEARTGLSEAQLMIRGVTGKWSVRDILAHVTTWEEEALKHLPLVLKGGKPPRYSLTYGGIDAFNALKTEQKKNLPLAQILEEMHDVHRRLIAYIESVPLGQFQEESRFRHRLRLDTYSHYPIHAKAIWNGEKSRDSELRNSFDPYFIEDEEPHRSTGVGHLFGVVKNDANGMAMPGTNPAHAVSQICSVEATRCLHGAMMHREGHGVPLT